MDHSLEQNTLQVTYLGWSPSTIDQIIPYPAIPASLNRQLHAVHLALYPTWPPSILVILEKKISIL